GQASLVVEPRVAVPTKGILLVETYPYSAWRRLGLPHLPGKRKCCPERVAQNAGELKRAFELPETKSPTHDELSALVAGLAGIAIAAGNVAGYIALGIPPKLLPEGHLVEGYIINPTELGVENK
ncbi:unnamed protein product, partial [marine sediment metagenome]